MLKKYKSRIVVFLSLLCLSPVNAQETTGLVTWSSAADSSVHVLSVITGEHIAYFTNHVDTLQQFNINYEHSNSLVGNNGKLFARDGLWIATFSGSGRVFEIDTINNTIDRQDRTFYQGYNFHAYQFQRKDTIYSFGGYGFWINNNLLTYFSEVRREWNLLSIAPFAMTAPDTELDMVSLVFYDRAHDLLYAEANNVLYAFDFRTYTWSKKGWLHDDGNADNSIMFHRMSDTTLLVMTSNEAREINFYGNTITDRSVNNGLIFNQTGPVYGFKCMYSLDEQTLLIPKRSDIIPVGYSFEYVTSKIKGNGQVPLFKSSALKLWGIIKILAVVFIIILLVRARKKLFLNSRKIKTVSKNFSLIQINTLRQLLSGPLLAEDLNSILNVQEKSWEVQRRQRSIFLRELNGLGVQVFKAELVLREKSPTDKRQVVYVVNSEIQDQLAQFLP